MPDWNEFDIIAANIPDGKRDTVYSPQRVDPNNPLKDADLTQAHNAFVGIPDNTVQLDDPKQAKLKVAAGDALKHMGHEGDDLVERMNMFIMANCDDGKSDVCRPITSEDEITTSHIRKLTFETSFTARKDSLALIEGMREVSPKFDERIKSYENHLVEADRMNGNQQGRDYDWSKQEQIASVDTTQYDGPIKMGNDWYP
ncbi:MAG: hypothetical protein KDI46_08310 [Alphaproteobacteria bacterium]|nr:hypothetical protein [Alphaproteobacteria bacterium]